MRAGSIALPKQVLERTVLAVVEQFAQRMAALRVPRRTPVAVALSGGPDSLALAALTAWWSGTCAALLSAAQAIAAHLCKPWRVAAATRLHSGRTLRARAGTPADATGWDSSEARG